MQKADGRSGQVWPGMATAAKVYGEIRSKVTSLRIPENDIEELPLWSSAISQRETEATYRCPARIRKGVLKIADLLQNGVLDKAKMSPIAPMWRQHYKEGIRAGKEAG